MELKELVGKRLLIKEEASKSGVIEVSIAEISPSGDFVKLGGKFGTGWRKAAGIFVEEILN